MANLTPTPSWDDVTQLELTTPATGGQGGFMNRQAQALLNRSEFLLSGINTLKSGKISVVASIADMLNINNPADGTTVLCVSYYVSTYAGGGHFKYNSMLAGINDGVLIFNGWVRQLTNNVVTVEMGGAKGDGATDDSGIIQSIVKVLYPSTLDREATGSGYELQFDPTKTYKILNQILLPPYCRLNGNGALLIGNDKANDCFVSAKWVGGVLTQTAGTAIGAGTYYTWSSIERFKFQKFNRNVYLYGWVLQCYLFKLDSLGSNQHIVSSEHYFLTVEQCSSDWTGTGTGLPNYYFGVYSGMLTLRNLSASSCDLGYFFASGLQAVTLYKLDAESVGTAIKMNGSGQTGGILVTGGYFENCGTVIDATEVGSANATIDMTNCFINGPDTIVCNTTGGNVAFIAKKENNYVQNHKTWLKELNGASLSKTSQGMLYVTHDTIAPNSPNGVSYDTNLYYENNPVAWCKDTHNQTVTSYRSASGKTQAIHEHYFSVIPATYYGNQGAPEPNIVPFCSHTMTTPSGGIFSCVITTGIVSNNFVQGTFNLELVTDNSAVGMLSGRFYQTKAVIDINDKTLTVSVSTVNNVIVLTIGGLTGSSYLCRGFVKLI